MEMVCIANESIREGNAAPQVGPLNCQKVTRWELQYHFFFFSKTGISNAVLVKKKKL